ncbi:hypothetical protein EBT31_06920 [bacterium]|nr:hypothetical protein [bacterium]
MAQQTINVGAAPNDGTGTPLRTAFQYTNSNFSELYTALGGGAGLPGATTQVIFNDGGTNLAGDAGLTYNKTTDTLSMGAATITGDLTVDTSTLKVDSANNRVGIGTASPSFPLHVQSATAVFKLESSTGTNPAYLYATSTGGDFYFGRDNSTGTTFGTGTGYSAVLYSANAYPMAFFTNATERMRIDSTGNLGLGVTPSAWGSSYKAIQVAANGVLYANGSNSLFLGGNYYNDSGGTNRYLVSNAATAYGQVSGAHQWYTAPSGTAGNPISGANAFVQVMTLDASGNLLVGVTSANASGGVLQLKSGITFPATQVASSDANTLDDYEEGTWTPSITFGGASVGMTGTFAGRYTKVGRAVTVNGIMALTSKGSSTGIARIAGLPFTSANASGEYTAISIRLDRVSFADYPCGYVGPNASVVELENTTNAGTVSSMTDSNFINTSVVIINFTYTA